MKVIVFYYAYGTQLCEARRLTEDEKERCAAWYRERGLIAVRDSFIDLDEIGWKDIPQDRESCGEFSGTSNYCYEVTDDHT